MLLLQLIVLLRVAGHEAQGGQKHNAQNGDNGQHANNQIARLLVDVRLVLELVVNEQIAKEHAALQQSPEDARIAWNCLRAAAARQIGALTRPGDRGAQTQHSARHIQQHSRWEQKGDHEEPAAIE